jgi:hypothetical protein
MGGTPALPRTGYENELLHQAVGETEVWLAYRTDMALAAAARRTCPTARRRSARRQAKRSAYRSCRRRLVVRRGAAKARVPVTRATVKN